ncbi:cytochrome c family protein [candidate division KSB1 bacterium]
MRFYRIIGLSGLALIFSIAAIMAQGTPKYVGASKCKACHMSKKKGDQFNKWKENRHASAFVTLGTDRAKSVAAEAGVSGDPQKADACLQCHVTAHGADKAALDTSYKMEEGVTCETCHGPGSLYRKASVMNAKKYAADPEGTVAGWKTMGLIMPDENLCKKCHNEKSPTYKPFDYKSFAEMIAHPNPNITKK